MTAGKQENGSAAVAAPLVDAAGWRVAAGDPTCVFVPGVAKPMVCGSKERARLVATAPELKRSLGNAAAALEYCLAVLPETDPMMRKVRATYEAARAALVSTTA